MTMRGADFFEKNIARFWANVKWKKSGAGSYSVGEAAESPMAVAMRKAKAKKNEKAQASDPRTRAIPRWV